MSSHTRDVIITTFMVVFQSPRYEDVLVQKKITFKEKGKYVVYSKSVSEEQLKSGKKGKERERKRTKKKVKISKLAS